MGQAKLKGSFLTRVQLAKQRELEESRAKAEKYASLEEWVTLMSQPLEHGEEVRYQVAGGVLTMITRSAVQKLPPKGFSVFEIQRAVWRINRALDIVQTDHWGHVSAWITSSKKVEV